MSFHSNSSRDSGLFGNFSLDSTRARVHMGGKKGGCCKPSGQFGEQWGDPYHHLSTKNQLILCTLSRSLFFVEKREHLGWLSPCTNGFLSSFFHWPCVNTEKNYIFFCLCDEWIIHSTNTYTSCKYKYLTCVYLYSEGIIRVPCLMYSGMCLTLLLSFFSHKKCTFSCMFLFPPPSPEESAKKGMIYLLLAC